MTDLPLVCICIPTYNSERTVRETLLSILSQTYRNLVVHISDNASTDDTIKVIESVADHRVRIHRQSVNVGGEENFTKCITLAEGKYTAIFHSDDLYESQMVERQVAFLERHAEAGAVFTSASTIDEAGKRFGEINFPVGLGSFDNMYGFETIFKAVLRHSNFLICSSVMARTWVYQQEIRCWRGGLFKNSADLDVWLRILRKHRVGMLPVHLMQYRISSYQYSAKVRSKTERSDFFLVMDHYLDQDDVLNMLNCDDIENYARLDRRDRIMRAVNLFLNSHYEEAKSLLHDTFSWKAWKAGLQSKRGFGVLIVGIYLRGLLQFRLEKTGQLTLSFFRRVLRR